jgi:hypothetical protein
MNHTQLPVSDQETAEAVEEEIQQANAYAMSSHFFRAPNGQKPKPAKPRRETESEAGARLNGKF